MATFLMRYQVAELLRAAHSRERQSNDVQSMPYRLLDIRPTEVLRLKPRS